MSTSKAVLFLCCLTAAFGLAPNVASAQSDLSSAAREAARYARCLNTADVECIVNLSYPQPNGLARWRPDSFPPLTHQSVLVRMGINSLPSSNAHWTLAIEPPLAVNYDSELNFAVVPYRIESFIGHWFDRRGYFLGVSDNNQKWCFIEDVVVAERGMDNIMPGYNGPALPEVTYAPRFEPGQTESDYLLTRMGSFSLRRDGGAYYELDLRVEKRIRQDMPVEISFENPNDPDTHYVVHSSLARKQDALRITSPLITGFRAGETYAVTVTGKDPDTGEVLFEHRQPMLYQPLETGFEDFIPAVATADERRNRGEASIFPSDWFQRFSVSADNLCHGTEPR